VKLVRISLPKPRSELERRAQELVDNLNYNVINQVPSDRQIRWDGDAEMGDTGTPGHGDGETRGVHKC